MKFKPLTLGAVLSISCLFTGNGIAGEKIMVDKEEYEQMKNAIKILMQERNQNHQAVQDAKDAAQAAAESAKQASETAEEATEVA